MATEVKLPDIGEGVNEGEIVRWLVKEGDVIKHDQPLVEVMTDKATVEIPSSVDGKVAQIIAKEGQVVKVGGALLSIDSGAAANASASASAASAGNGANKSSGAPVAPSAAGAQSGQPGAGASGAGQAQWQEGTAGAKAPPTPQQKEAASGMSTASNSAASGGAGEAQMGNAQDMYPPAAGANVLATPATRRYAREMGVDLNVMKGSGPSGRITREDVQRSGGNGGSSGVGTTGLGAVAGARPQIQTPAYKPAPLAPQSGEERKPFRGIRKKIAENLVRSKQIIPHFTHGDEADVTELVIWRTKMKDVAEKQGVKLTYLPIIMKALALTCREFPTFNASIDDAASEIVIKHNFNIGFAADTPEGLLVPVVKNVESKSVLEIAHDIITLAEKARANKLAPDDMKHGSITVTNIGSVGGTYATPIINHPEVAIIGVYSIQKKPVVIDDEITIREMMNISATCDHRLIDGALAARFLKKFKARLENPQSMLLEMI